MQIPLVLLSLAVFILMTVGTFYLNDIRKKFIADPVFSASQYFLRREGTISLYLFALFDIILAIAFILNISTGDAGILLLALFIGVLFYVAFTYTSAKILTSSHEGNVRPFGKDTKPGGL
ncbi:MAG: hypothetical protein V1934_07165 [Methanobacteriota archaeon]